MITCNLQGGFGNHLLCVGLGIILANKYNSKIKINGNGNGINNFSNDTRNTIFKIINHRIIADNNQYLSNNYIYINNKDDYYNAFHNYDSNYNYIINCIHIEDLNIYKENIDIINDNIFINKTFDYDYDNTITISLRLGCYGEVVYPSPFSDEESVRLPIEYFIQGINQILKKNKNINTLLICCDNFEDEFVKKFEYLNKEKINVIFNKKNTYDQFCDIINSKYFITSLSSFSLFGVLLNNNNCYVPYFNNNSTIKKNIGPHDEFYINASNTFYNMKNVNKIFI
jgi:hypothetical protein